MSVIKKIKPWELLDRKEMFSAVPWLKVFVDTIKLSSNRIVEDFYRIELPEYVMICAQNSEGEILLERQYKHGLEKITIVLPAGCLEDDEPPQEAAKRELLEETGYKAGTWNHVGSFVINGNRGCGKAHFYLAKDIKKVTEPVVDDTETSEILFMSVDSIVKSIKDGDISLLSTVSLVAIVTNIHMTKILE